MSIAVNLVNDAPTEDVGWGFSASNVSVSDCELYSGETLIKSLPLYPVFSSIASAPQDVSDGKFSAAQVYASFILNEGWTPGSDLGVHDGELRFRVSLAESVSTGTNITARAYAANLGLICGT